jgi:hypothetical protein
MEKAAMGESERLSVAEAVRAACIRAVLTSYEDAKTDGLCDEGAFEVAIDALRALNLRALLQDASLAGGS